MGELVFVESVASGHGPLSIPVAKECGFKVAFFAKDPEFSSRVGYRESPRRSSTASSSWTPTTPPRWRLTSGPTPSGLSLSTTFT